MDQKAQESGVSKRSAPPALDLHQTRRRGSSSPPTPLTSTRTPTFRKKWPSTPAKIKGPASDKVIHERALAELTLEEEDRKALNANAVKKNSDIGATGFVGGKERIELIRRVEERAKKTGEFDEMYSKTYDEYREPVDIEQGGLGVYKQEEEARREGEIIDPMDKSAQKISDSAPAIARSSIDEAHFSI